LRDKENPNPKNGLTLRGNRTKIDPHKPVVGANVTNAVTGFTEGEHQSAAMKKSSAKLARDFVGENKR